MLKVPLFGGKNYESLLFRTGYLPSFQSRIRGRAFALISLGENEDFILPGRCKGDATQDRQQGPAGGLSQWRNRAALRNLAPRT